jgi:P pilus assembly chaperone PapD
VKRILLVLLSCFLLIQSSYAGVSVIGNLARTTTIKSGDTFEGVIFLKNTDQKSAEIQLSQTDYLCQADGSNVYGEPGKTPRSNANWITVSPTRLKLAPGETQPVRYKGRAPTDPKLRGTFWSMIMIEPSSAPAITPEGKPDTVAVGLQTTIRFAVQIVTEIGQSGTHSLQVLDKQLVTQDGKRALQLDIGNDGEGLLVPTMTVELFDQKGASVGRFDAGRARIYPTCSVRAKVDLTDVPAGKYTAMVLLDGGDAQVMGAQYDLEIVSSQATRALAKPLVQNESLRVP